MTQQEYEQKKEECWSLFRSNIQSMSLEEAFSKIFNCIYTLGKHEKDTEKTPISERLYEEEKPQLEWLYYYLNDMVNKQEDKHVSVAVLFEAMKRLKNIFDIDILTNEYRKPIPKNTDTVIQAWVARDEDCFISIYQNKPIRYEYDCCGFWHDDSKSRIELPLTSFPYLTWDYEPIEVDIIIKKKMKL